ncbi:16S rRNA (uracil(1498)-N(3))-methyltransferase [Lichenihabitans sp. Uapishka_5]|uniref:16S rRNA (uracil(1498)-N(3))-methyltransferase n=1 Tax=Lichenihabitans sp. Uapishka_5 TaxID=3037302 RepID=UPI0029E806EA|nr:16S rRNA (uracil(1498)-N(3))-methyltransferase [Lichenihabitans sp. Uapishka_5]MDX7952072.1 16S rRNA (uracil(1498)-N(3))-methyltransferase [Lichenihabitans sp. Uapishka_5]
MPRYDFTAPRLFVDAPLAAAADVALDKPQTNYLRNVLRLGPEAGVLAFNGRDGEWRTTLALSGKAAVLRPQEQLRPQPPAPSLVYGFAPLKHARLDYMVGKAVEMGAGVLQPLLTQRTQVARINGDRMRANVVEAAEQCGILHLPEVRDPLRLDAWLADWPDDRLLVFCDEDAPVADAIAALRAGLPSGPAMTTLALVIGPEGGFDPRERAALERLPQAIRISLGPRILRADTAAVAALAVIQAVLGDWR